MRISIVLTAAVLVSAALFACSSGSSSDGDPFGDTGYIFPGRDVGGSTPDSGGVTDVPVGTPDVPVGIDLGPQPDVSGCGECPDDHPVCSEGGCACTAESCGEGRWCQHSACAYCTDDEHCTEDCIDCTLFGRVCTADGSSCIECGAEVLCETGYTCIDGDCLPCNIGLRCGDECVACDTTTPDCVAGGCVCNEESCPAGEWCANGVCETCDSDTRCGDACVDCTQTGTPVCTDGACRCTADLQCGPGQWCSDGACTACADDDPQHCGASCAVCAEATSVCSGGYCVCSVDADCPTGYWCGAEGCLPCDTSERCGDECVACPAERETCHEGACVECVVDGDCAAGNWCDAGTCAVCADDDALHCGASCALCEGATPLCAEGSCQCSGDSCGDSYRCVAGACDLCNEHQFCGPDCGACEAPTPWCLPDGTGCVACYEESHCADDYGCVDNVCVPDCLAEGCVSDTSPNREECGTAWVVGRTAAANGLVWDGDTTNAGDDDNLPADTFGDWSFCWDAQDDQFYRIYLMAGERLDVLATNLAPAFDMSLKLYEGTRCDRDDHDYLLVCRGHGNNGEDESFSHTAESDGWYTIVVDGCRGFDEDEDWGPYRISFTLTCTQANCCCYGK